MPHEEAFTQLKEDIVFQQNNRDINIGSLAYIGSQKKAKEF